MNISRNRPEVDTIVVPTIIGPQMYPGRGG
jgi:hypothetical protein